MNTPSTCPHCAAAVLPGDRFCPECGTSLDEPVEVRERTGSRMQGDERRPLVGHPPAPSLRSGGATSSRAPEQKRSGFTMAGGITALIVAALVVVWFLNADRSASSMHELDGSVLIFHEVNFLRAAGGCSGTGNLFDLIPGSPVGITPSGADPIYTELRAGSITPEGNCRLQFTAEIPESNRYVIQVGGRLPVEVNRRLIDRPDGWWVTLDWDATNPQPRP